MLDIKLSYTEGSGRVNRSYRLPENPKLVNSVLGAIKRHGPQEDKQMPVTGPTEGMEKPESAEETEEEAPEKKRKLYRGFVLVQCANCGEVRGACLKTPTNIFRCHCGEVTPMEGLVSAAFHCPCCGKQWIYRTNVENDPLVLNCMNCGAEMQSWWNKKKNRYEYAR